MTDEIRSVTARWVVTATLEMKSASQIGSQKADNADSTFERDTSGAQVLRGSTLAGALRSALTDSRLGYRVREQEPENKHEPENEIAKLFGSAKTHESPLIVFDALSSDTPHPSIRDGVRLDPKTGLAADKAKYDSELSLPGLTFPLRMELIVPSTDKEAELLRLLADALAALTSDAPPCDTIGPANAPESDEGAIHLGARRSRGLGACQARDFRARRYDMTSPQGWIEYAQSNPCDPFAGPDTPLKATAADAIKAVGGTLAREATDKRRRLRLDFDLTIPGTLLIRAPGQNAASADVAHLAEKGLPLLSGQSLAGALRARAERIVHTLNLPNGDKQVNDLFGKSPELARADKKPTGSRVFVGETVITDSRSYRQTRTKIDRFTGGTVDGALFDEEPCVGGQVRVGVEVRDPKPEDIGLLLLVARDLVEGLLPLGGEASIGRGVLRGRVTATLPDAEGCFTLIAAADGVAPVNEIVKQELSLDDVQRLYIDPLVGGPTP